MKRIIKFYLGITSDNILTTLMNAKTIERDVTVRSLELLFVITPFVSETKLNEKVSVVELMHV